MNTLYENIFGILKGMPFPHNELLGGGSINMKHSLNMGAAAVSHLLL